MTAGPTPASPTRAPGPRRTRRVRAPGLQRRARAVGEGAGEQGSGCEGGSRRRKWLALGSISSSWSRPGFLLSRKRELGLYGARPHSRRAHSRTPQWGCYLRPQCLSKISPREKRVLYVVDSQVQADSLVLKVLSCTMFLRGTLCWIFRH